MVEMQLDILGSHKYVSVRCMISTLESGVRIVGERRFVGKFYIVEEYCDWIRSTLGVETKLLSHHRNDPSISCPKRNLILISISPYDESLAKPLSGFFSTSHFFRIYWSDLEQTVPA